MVRISRAQLHHLPGAYRVCALTAGAGEGLPEGSVSWLDPQIVGHVYVGPYFPADGLPVIALVATDHLGVAGYCLAATNTVAWAQWCDENWWPALRDDYPLDADYPAAEREMVQLIHAPAVAPADVVASYPAHLHIDLLDRVRGTGLGRQLMGRMLDALRDAGAAGVHLGVGAGNENAIGFYRHLGFRVLDTRDGVTLALGWGQPAT